MTDLSELKTKRAVLKTRLTKCCNHLLNFKDGDNINQLKVRQSTVEQIYIDYCDIQTKIDLVDSTDEQADYRDAFDNQYFDFISGVTTILDNHAARATIVQTPQRLSTESRNTQFNSKLPILSLPEFSGSYTQWRSFYDSFKTIIHENETLSETQKFHYLKSCLKNEASRAIENLSITNENYNVALAILARRYKNQRLIIHEHVRNILKSPALTKPNHVNLRQLINDIINNLEALNVLNQPVNQWDALIVPIITEKLDYSTSREWQSKLNSELPTLVQLTEFLETRCQFLESLNFESVKTNTDSKHKFTKTKANVSTHVITKKPACYMCKGDNHFIYNCADFLKLNIPDRIKQTTKLNLCRCCLRNNHETASCRSIRKCRECNLNHNTLLHKGSELIETNRSVNDINHNIPTSSNAHCLNAKNSQVNVLLSTAIVQIKDNQGIYQDCRALLDVGSQSNFITQALCNKLNLKLKHTQYIVSGINQATNRISFAVNIDMKSKFNDYNTKLNCLVVPKVTNNLPQQTIPLDLLKIPSNIQLADPHFNISNTIDLLISAEIFWDLLCIGQAQVSPHQPHFQKSHLGWLAGGVIKYNAPKAISNCSLGINSISTPDPINMQIEKFWAIEDHKTPITKTLSLAEQKCETHFVNTHKRDSQGRFIIKLPTISETIKLGNSKEMALSRFVNLEKKLDNNPQLKLKYSEFINEYLSLNHMELVPLKDIEKHSYYLPHHAVFKESSLTTKLRVVFDASAKSTNGLSLNDNLLIGPTLQQDLFNILTRFRTHKFAVTADISKMYRQIKIDPEDANYQRILWRNNSIDPISIYRLTTLTYGTNCAPFIAVRCLHQLAYDNKNNYKRASEAILNDFYVDDVLSGCESLEETIKLRDEISHILLKGGFELCKVASNHRNILPTPTQETAHLPLINLDKNGETKTLGMLWNCHNDVFKYQIKNITVPNKITKRTILSIIAQIFDPLGLIGPIIINSKLMIQKLWALNSNWDESVPTLIYTEFSKFINQLHNLNQLQISRRILLSPTNYVELHGFSDASEKAYGAAIYLRSINERGEVLTSLLCAKSRVAPLKTITLARLELCGALLLATLTNKVLAHLNITINKKYFWTDSTIVLAWLKSESSRWKIFIANRVAEIHSHTNVNDWYHIKGKENPSDLLSRGVTVETLINSHLWWHGPDFLRDINFHPNTYNIQLEDLQVKDLEERKVTSAVSTNATDIDLMHKYSSFSKLQRIVALMFRFYYNLKNKQKCTGHLTTTELNHANKRILKVVQHQQFSDEIQDLKSGNQIRKNSKLLKLDPFLDEHDLIRVGGRLKNTATLSYDTKFPIIIPKNHHITKLIIMQTHVTQLHAGPQATLAAIRQSYWPIYGRSIVRQILHKCIVCYKTKPIQSTQKMGNLPRQRIEPIRPFLKSGLDYCGPILIKEGRGRGKRSVKAYIALFICFATKAIHLELVGDLTTDSFLNALKRFMSRRGLVSHIFSDNATNFIGAKKVLNELSNFLNGNEFHNKIIMPLIQNNIHWSFIPPRSPNFGGIWEANVKPVKIHLNRVVANALLTYEELYTVLTRIEACLNSRPLTPISSDPNDLMFLTPGHFLIGESLTAPIEPNLEEIKLNRLDRWQLVERIRQHFWRRWSREYLSQLQGRSKWHQKAAEVLKPGTMVLLIENNLPPLHWPLGRIVDIHPGSDGLIRVVTVKTIKGLFKRGINKVCVLPIDSE